MQFDNAQKLINHIHQDMHRAMKNRSATELGELRSLLARITNAEAVDAEGAVMDADTASGAAAGVGTTEVQRKILTAADLQAVITAERQEIESTLASVGGIGDYADALREKLAVVKRYQSI